MKKLLTIFLTALILTFSALSLACFSGCANSKTPQQKNEETPHRHSFVQKNTDDIHLASRATCTQRAKYYYSCSCGVNGSSTFEYGSFVHVYNLQVADEEYMAAPKTCTQPARYYYSCKCGAKGSETFKYGDFGHSYTDGTCDYCGQPEPGDVVDYAKDLEYRYDSETKTYSVYRVTAPCWMSDIVIPDSYDDGINGRHAVTDIEVYAFASCDMKSVTISKNIISIGQSAFRGCKWLSNVYLHEGITSISYDAFDECYELIFNEYDNALYLGDDKNPYIALIQAKNKNITSCVINEKTKIIASQAFLRCANLVDMNIPDSVISIGEFAFAGSGIVNLKIGNGMEIIERGVFMTCINLHHLIIGEKVTIIGSYAFMDCGNLTCVIIPDNVLSIESRAFDSCEKLMSIIIGENVSYIGYDTFEGCYRVVEIINKSKVAVQCPQSSSYFYKTSGTTRIKDIGEYLFYIDDDYNYLIGYTGDSKELTLPDLNDGESYGIYWQVFNVRKDITCVTIPVNVKFIDGSIFWGCEKLTTMNYLGTMEQWSNIIVDTYWAEGSNISEVICSDGVIEITKID